jgi:hypothetical protein
MSTLPTGCARLTLAFTPLFSKRVFQSAEVVLFGAILAIGKRTVTSVLRVMGLDQQAHFQTYHRVLNRAAWSPLAASRILSRLLVRAFAPQGPLIFGLDDTIERRWGAKIGARGIYRDPVRSSRSHFVKVSGLGWLCMMLLVRIPWAARVWALPFFTAPCPSERYHERLGKRHKTLTDWARQMVRQVRQWLPGRPIVIVADSAFAALDFLDATKQHATIITRLRLDAALCAPTPARHPKQRGRPCKKGARLPTLREVLAHMFAGQPLSHLDCQRFFAKHIDNYQGAEFGTVGKLVRHKVHTPYLIGLRGFDPDLAAHHHLSAFGQVRSQLQLLLLIQKERRVLT